MSRKPTSRKAGQLPSWRGFSIIALTPQESNNGWLYWLRLSRKNESGVKTYVTVKWKVWVAQSLSHIWVFAIPQTVARQDPLSMGFSRQQYRSGLPFPSLGDLPTQGWNSGLLQRRWILYHPRQQGSPSGDNEQLKEQRSCDPESFWEEKDKKYTAQRSFPCISFLFSFFFFFKFIFISWRLITVQYCSGFCHTLTWISHGFTCVPHPDPPSLLPPHPIPLGLPSAPARSTCLMHPTWAGDLFTLDSIVVSMLFSQNIPPSPSPIESTSLFYTSVYVSLFLSCI